MELLLKITESDTLNADEISAFRDKAIQAGASAESLLAKLIRAEIAKPSKTKKGARK